MSDVINDAKKVKEQVAPLIEKFKNKKSDKFSISRLIKELLIQEKANPLSEDGKRGIIFEFRDKGFLDYKETQELWLDLAESWGVDKHLPHLIRKN